MKLVPIPNSKQCNEEFAKAGTVLMDTKRICANDLGDLWLLPAGKLFEQALALVRWFNLPMIERQTMP